MTSHQTLKSIKQLVTLELQDQDVIESYLEQAKGTKAKHDLHRLQNHRVILKQLDTILDSYDTNLLE